MSHIKKLKLLPQREYQGINTNEEDPLKYYYWPILGKMYQRRVELCLNECQGGERILEVGYGNGLTFINLSEEYSEIHGLDLKTNADEVVSVFQRHSIQVSLQQGDVIQMPYPNDYFDTVLLISILEHLKPAELTQAISEIWRVLKPGGDVIYGVPVERPLMVFMFRMLGYDIRKEHFSTEKQVAKVAHRQFGQGKIIGMKGFPPLFGNVYEVGHFQKQNPKDNHNKYNRTIPYT